MLQYVLEWLIVVKSHDVVQLQENEELALLRDWVGMHDNGSGSERQPRESW
jgi:hypothetical protein